MTDKPNSANGRHSYDSTGTGELIPFFNRNVSEYNTDQGVKFELVPVKQQKDLMLNVARLHAQQEYDRIMELVGVLQRQAEGIKRRLEVTDWVHAAQYSFQLYPGNKYWLLLDTRHDCTRLTQLGPDDWATAAPTEYNYICQVQWMGDSTWIEIEGKNV